MANKKKENRGGGKLTDDPPIIVGGGGSVLVFIKGTATPVTPSPIEGYNCFQLAEDIHVLRLTDGITPRIRAIPVAPARFSTNFEG